MKVTIKKFDVDMELKNNGVTFDIYDNSGNYLGDIRLGKATIEWCKGKTRPGNGYQKTWDELMAWFENR
jgi:hypothetical protein